MNFNLNLSKNLIAIFIVWLFQLSAIIGISIGFEEWFVSKTPLNLFIQIALLIWVFSVDRIKKIPIAIILFSIGMIVEIIGVYTSYPFGSYSYGNNLGPKIFEVPFLIGCNWAMLIFVTSSVALRFSQSILIRSLLGAAMMTLLDISIEIVAPKFDYWQFELSQAPIENYLAWFIISFFMHLFAQHFKFYGKSSLPIYMYLSQVLFFTYFAFY